MALEPIQRRKWAIDCVLDGLISADIRVAARAFSPLRWTGETPPRMVPVRDLILPDNSQSAGLPVFFEGRFRRFERHIGVVLAWLDPPTTPDGTAEGVVCFRGHIIVIVRGPALVELAFPFQVERLPADPVNYWRDLRVPRAQFELPFPASTGDAHTGSDRKLADSVIAPHSSAPPSPEPVSFQRSTERCLRPVDLPPPNTVDRNNGVEAVKGESCRSQPRPNQTPIRNLNYSP